MYINPSTISLFDSLHDQENVLPEQGLVVMSAATPLQNSESSSDAGSNQEELVDHVLQGHVQEFDNFYWKFQKEQEPEPYYLPPAHYELGREPIDTHQLATHIRTILSTLRLPQSRVGEVLLARTAGTFSDLLAKPSHWNEIGPLKRANYQRLLYWSRLTRDEQRLVMRMEHREYSEHIGLPVLKVKERRERVRRREMFSQPQKDYLKEEFQKCSEPTKEHMEWIAESLGLKVERVKTYFLNNRNRSKIVKQME